MKKYHYYTYLWIILEVIVSSWFDDSITSLIYMDLIHFYASIVFAYPKIVKMRRDPKYPYSNGRFVGGDNEIHLRKLDNIPVYLHELVHWTICRLPMFDLWLQVVEKILGTRNLIDEAIVRFTELWLIRVSPWSVHLYLTRVNSEFSKKVVMYIYKLWYICYRLKGGDKKLI
jgi:hypothetical protein